MSSFQPEDTEDLNFIACGVGTIKAEGEFGFEDENVEDAVEGSFGAPLDYHDLLVPKGGKMSDNKRNKGSGPKPFKCHLCDYAAARNYQLMCHIKARHEKVRNFKCPACPLRTFEFNNLAKHMKLKHPGEPLPSYPRGHALKGNHGGSIASLQGEQMVNINSEETEALRCDLCNFTTSLERLLTQHMDEKHPERFFEPARPPRFPFKCVDCEYATSIESYLSSHRKMNHEIVRATCDKCEFEANITRVKMINHKIVAHGEVEILAEHRENMKVEIVVKVQSENMEQMEDEDEGSFQSTPGTTKDSVQEENEKSGGDKDDHMRHFKCHLCSKYLSSLSSMKRHIASVHEKIRHYPFKCDVCPHTSSSKYRLRVHKERMHS